jgi:cyclopropane fatty-acyl-phospholipid synthase-like methyltransferase
MEWYKSWFDSPYYHILYSHRDETEAKHFLDKIISHLHLKTGMKILDAACGRGRHSMYLNKKGFDVIGYDLSAVNCAYNKKSECKTLHFLVHDMRKPFRENYFDVALNLFSSFGYFETEDENRQAIRSLSQSLVKGGQLLIDFMNAEHAAKRLRKEEIINIKDVTFKIRKHIENNFIVKTIDVEDQGRIHENTEKVMLLDRSHFENYFNETGLKTISVLGNYNLEPFDPAHSERLIIIAEKISG